MIDVVYVGNIGPKGERRRVKSQTDVLPESRSKGVIFHYGRRKEEYRVDSVERHVDCSTGNEFFEVSVSPYKNGNGGSQRRHTH